MTKSYKVKNELMKRKYFKWIASSEGYSEKTIHQIEKALWIFDEFLKNDYGIFNMDIADQFKTWLKKRIGKKRKKTMALSTQLFTLQAIRNFLTWLSAESGYRSRLKHNDIKCLKLNREESRKARSSKRRKHPSVAHVLKLCQSIDITSESAQRDRALIAFLFLSGARIKASTTLPLKCINLETKEVFQCPKENVETKYSKQIYTTLHMFDDTLYQYFADWIHFLKNEKLFQDTDPVFPRTVTGYDQTKSEFKRCLDVEPYFWKTPVSVTYMLMKRAKQAGLPYYSPHEFRHGTIAEARKFCRTEEQRKAMSQNLGHARTDTTFEYGNMDSYRVNQVISGMGFQNTGPDAELLKTVSTEDLMNEIQSRMNLK